MAQLTDHPTKLLRLNQVRELVPYSKSALYGMISRGEFPKPVKIGASPKSRASFWVAEEVYSWLDERLAEARSAA